MTEAEVAVHMPGSAPDVIEAVALALELAGLASDLDMVLGDPPLEAALLIFEPTGRPQ